METRHLPAFLFFEDIIPKLPQIPFLLHPHPLSTLKYLFAGEVDWSLRSCYLFFQRCLLLKEGTLEEEMATHSSILALKIPQTVEPGRL